jgi:uncharacterized membrane protein
MFAARLICALSLATGAFCQTYVEISVHDYNTTPFSINKKGEIAGSYINFAEGINHGFVRDPGGTITIFDVPGSSGTVAQSINDSGAITGYYVISSGIHGYIRDPKGSFTSFDLPGIGSSFGIRLEINAGGAVTGTYQDASHVAHGFLRRPDGTLLSIPGSIPVSINAKGAITGQFFGANPQKGFVREPGGEFVLFDVPGSTGVFPCCINDSGAITGDYLANGRFFGFVRDPQGNLTSFDPGYNVGPTSINNKGAITGSYADITQSHTQDFVRSPDGTITSFEPPYCFSTGPGGPQSINDEGVITGWCATPSRNVGFVRFP